MKSWKWSAVLVTAVILCHQMNGIWEALESHGMVGKSDTTYQFMTDFGRNLSLLVASVSLWCGSDSKYLRMAGMFIVVSVASDTSGLVLNPEHYDSWKWELGCALLASMFVSGVHVVPVAIRWIRGKPVASAPVVNVVHHTGKKPVESIPPSNDVRPKIGFKQKGK